MIRIRKLLRSEAGITLPEMLVGVALSLVVGLVLTTGTIALFRAQAYTSSDSQTLISLRVVLDRFEKEVRQARKFYPDSNARSAHFWVDYDRDNQQDLSERVVWRLVSTGGTTARVERTTDVAGATVDIVTSGLVLTDAFVYCMPSNTPVTPCTQGRAASPNNTYATLIQVSFTADAVPAVRTPQRTVRTEVRLRNATAP